MSDPITITVDAGWLTRAWACVPKTAADFKALPGKIAGKIGNSIAWTFNHTEAWLAMLTGIVIGAAFAPNFTPHLKAWNVPVVESERAAPVVVDLRSVTQQLDRVQADMTAFNRRANEMDARIVAIQGTVAGIKDFTDGVPMLLAQSNPFRSEPAPAAAPAPRPKPQPVAKKPPAATPEAPKPAPAAEPAALGLPDWLKSKL